MAGRVPRVTIDDPGPRANLARATKNANGKVGYHRHPALPRCRNCRIHRCCRHHWAILGAGSGHGDRSVVDLAPGEWQQVPDREFQNKLKKSDRD
jgi:hypothetical protein